MKRNYDSWLTFEKASRGGWDRHPCLSLKARRVQISFRFSGVAFFSKESLYIYLFKHA